MIEGTNLNEKRVIVGAIDDAPPYPTDSDCPYPLDEYEGYKPSLSMSPNNDGDKEGLQVITAHDLLVKELPPRTNLLNPWLPKQGICMIHAQRGVGKTHLSVGIACTVAAGSKFLDWEAPEPAGVLLVDGEMPAKALQDRLLSTILSTGKPLAPLNIITPDLQKHGMPNLGTPGGQAMIDRLITGIIDLIIVDNISTLVRSGRENEAEGWQPVQEWALKWRARGKTVLFIHHSNKNGGQRGTSKREDILDTVICLQHPRNYTPEDGACFEVHYEKSRGIHGNDVKPFEAKLAVQEDNSAIWTTKSLEASTYDKVVDLFKSGLKQNEIAEDLGIHKSNVSRHIKCAKERGEVTGR